MKKLTAFLLSPLRERTKERGHNWPHFRGNHSCPFAIVASDNENRTTVIPSEVEESFRGQRPDERPFDYAQGDSEYFRGNLSCQFAIDATEHENVPCHSRAGGNPDCGRFANRPYETGRAGFPACPRRQGRLRHPAIFVTMTMAALGAISLAGCGQPSTPPAANAPSTSATPTTAPRDKEPWQQQWETVVSEAKKEGTVSIIANWGPKSREGVIAALKGKYGISAEVSSLGASQAGEKILTERRAGLYNYDLSVHGANFGVNLMKPAAAFDPAGPALVLPEVKDPGAWLGGEFPWFDRDRTMIPFLARLDTNLSINTDLVKPGEITSYQDLLAPRWKGKIILRDPTTIGAGSGWFRENGRDLGLDYMRALAKQEPVVLENDRQCVEWLARGRYAVLIAGNDEMLNTFRKEGAPVEILDAKDSRTLGPMSGIASLINRPPHPYATKLVLNWLLTQEGQTIITQTVGTLSRRLDAPTDHIPRALIPQPGRKYTEYSEESVARDAEALKMSREIFGPLLGKGEPAK